MVQINLWMFIMIFSFIGIAVCIFPTGGGGIADFGSVPMRKFSDLEIYGAVFFTGLFFVSSFLYDRALGAEL